ncbi:unnamed protein product, partial [Polarella glacialis]
MPLQCLRSMPRQHVRPFVDSSIVEATSAIAAAGRAGAWHFVVDVLHRARSTGLELDSAIFNSAASAVRRSQHWELSLQLVTVGRQDGLPWSTRSLNALGLASRGLAVDDRFDPPGTVLSVSMFIPRPTLDQVNLQTASVEATLGTRLIGEFRLTLREGRPVEAVGNCTGRKLVTAIAVVAFGALASAFESGRQWERALSLLDVICQAGLQPSLTCCNSGLSACEKGGQWTSALSVLQGTQVLKVSPDAISFNAAISACGGVKRWAQAVHGLEALLAAGSSPDIITFNSLLSACECSCRWRPALALLERLLGFQGLRADQISFNSALSACQKSGRWQRVICLAE